LCPHERIRAVAGEDFGGDNSNNGDGGDGDPPSLWEIFKNAFLTLPKNETELEETIEDRDLLNGLISEIKKGFGLLNESLATLMTLPVSGGEVTIAKGISVIGPRATYRQFAKEIGAKYLNVTNKAWTWPKNEKFLAGVVKRGDDVLFAGKFNPKKLDPTSTLAREINYLIDNGYKWTSDFVKLIKK
jgi:hypothetical protein